MFTATALFAVLLLGSTTTTASSSIPAPCTLDSDCPAPIDTPAAGAYACIDRRCRFLVAAAEPCAVADDCAAFHATRALNPLAALNRTSEWCAPRFCSIQSTCGGAWTLPDAPSLTTTQPLSCCAGIPANNQCALVAQVSVDPCASDASCVPRYEGVSGHVCRVNDHRQTIWIGVIMVLVGATTLNIGLNLQKLGYRHWDTRATIPSHTPRHPHSAAQRCAVLRDKLMFWRHGPFLDPIWLLGFALFLFGNIVNFVALRFAPQSLVAPLSAISLVTNVVIAPWINKERISRWDVAGIVLICIGSAVAIVFSGYVAPEYKLCVLINLLQRTATVVYLCIIGAGVLVLWIFIRIMERRFGTTAPPPNASSLPPPTASSDHHTTISPSLPPTWPKSSLPSDAWAPSHPSTPSTATVTPLAHSPAALVPIEQTSAKTEEDTLLPRRLSSVSERAHDSQDPEPVAPPTPRTTVTSRYLLPLSYAALGGLMGTLTTLFAKSLINLLSASLAGDNQFTHVLSWVILLVTAVTAISQVFWINMGLRRYDALLQVPVFYCVWTVFDIIGGAIYYDEFRLFGAREYALFSLGVLLIFTGVGLLSKRLSRIEESNQAAERA